MLPSGEFVCNAQIHQLYFLGFSTSDLEWPWTRHVLTCCRLVLDSLTVISSSTAVSCVNTWSRRQSRTIALMCSMSLMCGSTRYKCGRWKQLTCPSHLRTVLLPGWSVPHYHCNSSHNWTVVVGLLQEDWLQHIDSVRNGILPVKICSILSRQQLAKPSQLEKWPSVCLLEKGALQCHNCSEEIIKHKIQNDWVNS